MLFRRLVRSSCLTPALLNLPPSERPHFITLYYSNTDHVGHDFGPDSLEEQQQVHHVDELMGD